jgi:putative mRNA 3-end processing factor
MVQHIQTGPTAVNKVMAQPFESWLRPEAKGLYCVPGDFYIDPHEAVDRAIITHGHSDHARGGHNRVLATAETLEVMKLRLGAASGASKQAARLGEVIAIGDVTVSLAPAGHILGSAQVVIDYNGQRAVVSGDYKRRSDPTCTGFELVRCDLFITEATFALPVFKHEPDDREIGKLLRSLTMFSDRTHQIGVYSLGKCQRLVKLLRNTGYDAPIYLHGSMIAMCDLYRNLGIDLGDLRPVSESVGHLAGAIVLCPPSAIGDRWSRRFADPIPAFASGWMRIRARARQRGVELPLIISDHVDWPELLQTVKEVEAQEIWITHGRDDVLTLACRHMGLKARALAMVGYDEEGE